MCALVFVGANLGFDDTLHQFDGAQVRNACDGTRNLFGAQRHLLVEHLFRFAHAFLAGLRFDGEPKKWHGFGRCCDGRCGGGGLVSYVCGEYER